MFKHKDSLLIFDCLEEQSAREHVFNESESESSSDDGSDIEERESEEAQKHTLIAYENPLLCDQINAPMFEKFKRQQPNIINKV